MWPFDRNQPATAPAETLICPLSSLRAGSRGRVARVVRDLPWRAERLAAMGVSSGATIVVLQTFPGIVFECDQTELAVERMVARSILVELERS
ncbi:MAG TPA: ferrous iron transport protein A [Vicinamibacterales bacterium]|jgi:Fe2+ transport system protein FeoA|nr:ferrous iron transport protein A [Vicinamibacterales bacterium]